MPENGKIQTFNSGSLALVSVGVEGETLSYLRLFHEIFFNQRPLPKQQY
jgi:hypothetical protein